MKTLHRRHSAARLFRDWGFTLIELLVVVVIIAILAGIIIRGTAFVNQKVGRARAMAEMQQIKHAIVEFHAKYGIFPPVWSNQVGFDPMTGDRYPDTMAYVYMGNVPWGAPRNIGYSTGLVYYIGNDDIEGYELWAPYVADLIKREGGGVGPSNQFCMNNPGAGWMYWTNNYRTWHDPWGRPYVYESHPSNDYQSFWIFSRGPNASRNVPEDDLGVSSDE